MLFLASLPAPARAAEPVVPDFDRDGPTFVLVAREAGDTCQFFRIEASNEGVAHYSRDMLAACEEIDRRRTAGMPLDDRLVATAAMLETYREALTAAGAAALVHNSRSGLAPWTPALSDAEKFAIADSTGALLVLEAIRNGF